MPVACAAFTTKHRKNFTPHNRNVLNPGPQRCIKTCQIVARLFLDVFKKGTLEYLQKASQLTVVHLVADVKNKEELRHAAVFPFTSCLGLQGIVPNPGGIPFGKCQH